MQRRRDVAAQDLQNDHKAGICSTCVHAASCVWVARALTPVWQCSEFDDGPAPAAALATRAASAPAMDSGAAGLCVNCGNAAACTLPGRVTGVWYCTEHC